MLQFQLNSAQSFTSFANWNHAGISGVYLQPASIADTRLKFDMTVFGMDINVGNSLYGLKRGFLFSGNIDDKFNDYKRELTNIKNHKGLISADLQVLNFMVPISPKSAIGFTCRARYMLNIEGIDPDLLRLIDDGLDIHIGDSYSIQNLAMGTNLWAELGLTYAREIMDWGPHYLKGGVSLKLIQPMSSGYIHIKDAGYSIKPDDDIWVKASGELAVPQSFDDLEDFVDPDKIFNDWNSFKIRGVGFDIGAVYEYRPEHMSYKETRDNTSIWNRYEPSRYLFRVGISVLDIGSMKYDTDHSMGFSMDSQKSISEDNITNISDLTDLFELEPSETNYRMALPTAISLQTDWRITRYFYLGINPYFALRSKVKNKINTHYVTSINLTPRFEMAGLGVSLPFTYDGFRSFNVGLGLNLGPLWIGSNNIFNVLISDKLRSLNFCMGMKISIFHKNKS